MVYLPDAEFAQRPWAHATRFSQVHSSRRFPVETCGGRAENGRLVSLACDDGKPAFASRAAAEAARRGAVGNGGRCGSILDLYDVPCPERHYKIYMDLYVCPASARPAPSPRVRYSLVVDQGMTIAVPRGWIPSRQGAWAILHSPAGNGPPVIAIGPVPPAGASDAHAVAAALAALHASPAGAVHADGAVLYQPARRGKRVLSSVSYFDRRDLRVATLLTPQSGRIRRGDGELLAALARRSGRNQHRYVDYAALARAAAARIRATVGRIATVPDRKGGLAFRRPASWTATATAANAFDAKGPEGALLCQTLVETRAEAPAAVISALVYSIPVARKVILFDDDRPWNAHLTVVRFANTVSAIYARLDKDAKHGILCSWVSHQRGFPASEGVALFEMMIASVHRTVGGAGGK